MQSSTRGAPCVAGVLGNEVDSNVHRGLADILPDVSPDFVRQVKGSGAKCANADRISQSSYFMSICIPSNLPAPFGASVSSRTTGSTNNRLKSASLATSRIDSIVSSLMVAMY